MTEAEGKGNGRCIIVLMGGRSGGHQAAVLGAVRWTSHIDVMITLINYPIKAFHPQLPVLATCGVSLLTRFPLVALAETLAARPNG
jgi:polycomb protein EED